VVAYHDFLGPRATEDSEYNRWLAGHSGEVLGADIRSQSGFEARLRVTRTHRGARYTSADVAALQRLIPPLRNALELYQALEANRSEHSVYSGAIEQLSVGVVVLDHDRRIARTNAVADAILAQGDGIGRSGDALRFLAASHRARIDTLLGSGAASSGGPLAILRVERPSGRRDYGVAIHHMTLPGYMRTGSSPALMLLISDPERPVLADVGALRERFGLTRKEAQLAGELAAGLSLDEAALRLGVSRNTARSHLRGLFTKTGVSRQGELVRLVHASLPGLGSRAN
jgi:DNA-binding CsgD family transcriptional regulator/PAS domain-containing protein